MLSVVFWRFEGRLSNLPHRTNGSFAFNIMFGLILVFFRLIFPAVVVTAYLLLKVDVIWQSDRRNLFVFFSFISAFGESLRRCY